MSNFRLRDARPQDSEAIRDLTIGANEEYGELMPDAWETYKENIVQTLAHVAPAEQIVAEQDGQILGAVLLYPSGIELEAPDGTKVRLDYPEVRLLAVKPSARGQGIAHALMRECIERARRAGSSGLSLHTTDIMRVAMRMYEKMGFVRTPETDFGAGPDVFIKGYRYSLA